MTAFKVGLTGGLASGKSTVAAWLAESGFRVVDADRLVAELYAPGAPGVQAVAELCGRGFIDALGGVDRERLAALVFADPELRRRLEAAIHPLVRDRFAEIARASAGVVVLEATLLVEAGYAPDFDLVVTVEAPPESLLRRAVARGLTEADARARLAAQGSGERRRAAADRVLKNDGELSDLKRQVEELGREIQQLAGNRQDS